METIVIGKPAINVYLPLQEYPQEGDVFVVNSKNESIGNVGATAACLLGKWGESVHFTGVVGNDSYAEKIRDGFKNNKVNSKYMETNFTSNTSINYITLNLKGGTNTKVLFNEPEVQLTKYKYDFIPGFAILDGTDFAGAIALLNNNGGSCKTVLYARRGDKDTINLSKKCTYVVCTESFVEGLTHEKADGSAEGYVNLYQKIVDTAGNSNFIVILNNHKILYADSGAVKMLPEMKINIVDYSSFDSVFVGALSFALIHDLTLDDAIKFANTAGALSITKIGEEPAIPVIDEVLNNSGLREKFGLKEVSTTTTVEPTGVNPMMQNQSVQAEPTPVVNATVNETPQVPSEVSTPQSVETPVAPVAPQVPSTPVVEPVVTQVEASTPVQQQVAAPQPQIEQVPVQQKETNIFDNPPQQQPETNIFDNPNV